MPQVSAAAALSPQPPPATPTTPPAAAPAIKADAFWGAFDAKVDPKILGKKVCDDLLSRTFSPAYRNRPGIDYREICDAYGCLRFAGETADKERVEKLIAHYATILTPDGQWLVTRADNVDNSVWGILPMEIYKQQLRFTPDAVEKKWLDLGIEHADTEWLNPQPDGLSRFTRYWIDDMFMIPALQCQAYRVTHDKKYLDRAADEMVAYLKRLQQPNGLFFHGEDAPFFWGRGNGWMSAGSAEMLSILPPDHPKRQAILDGYRKMMAGLLKYQGKDGMWKQLVDKDNSWPETSGSGMFIFGMALGVRNGWLDEKDYKDAVKKGWEALAPYMNPDGKVRECCVGTNKFTGAPAQGEAYYDSRQRAVGDFHGQAAFIWAAWAMSQDSVAK